MKYKQRLRDAMPWLSQTLRNNGDCPCGFIRADRTLLGDDMILQESTSFKECSPDHSLRINGNPIAVTSAKYVFMMKIAVQENKRFTARLYVFIESVCRSQQVFHCRIWMELTMHPFGYILKPHEVVRQAVVIFDRNWKFGYHLHTNLKLLIFVLKRFEATAGQYSF